MKICIIGNSHLAALKLGWTALEKEYPDIEITFFGCPARSLDALVVKDNKLIPSTNRLKQMFLSTSQGYGDIDFNNFDKVFVCGVGCDVDVNLEGSANNFLYQLLKEYRLSCMSDETRKVISQACLTKICTDMLICETSLSFKLVTQIRTISHIPVFIIPAPFSSQDCLQKKHLSFLVSSQSLEVQQCYYSGVRQAFQSVNATLISQPEHTIVGYIFSKPQFSVGSIRLSQDLSTPHSQNDYAHMNQEYGKEVLKNAFTYLH